MRLPRAPFTIMGMMFAFSLVAAALAALPEPAFVIRLPNTSTAAASLPDGSVAMPRATADIHVTRLGAMLLAAVAGAITLVARWVAGRLIRIARRPVAPDPPAPE